MVLKQYNLKRHFESKHSNLNKNYSSEMRIQKISYLPELLKVSIFFCCISFSATFKNCIKIDGDAENVATFF